MGRGQGLDGFEIEGVQTPILLVDPNYANNIGQECGAVTCYLSSMVYPKENKVKTKRLTVGLITIILSIAVTACGGILGVNTATGEEVEVNNVKILTVGSNPANYFAEVSGLLPDGCSQIGENVQEVNNSTIEVTLYSTRSDDDCSFLNPTPFKEKVSLDVRGAPAGTYNVEVNGVIARGSLIKE
jgi:hypothetical protein